MEHKAVFLDRDDTIIADPGYINDPAQVKLLPGVTTALKELHNLGFKLIVITNQSGIARGILSEQQLDAIHKRLKQLLSYESVYLDGIYYCPYHPEGTIAKYTKESDLRKPNSGMILKAAEEMKINLAKSWMIGDSDRDTLAGKTAGCKTILVQPSPSQAEIKYTAHNADFTASNMKEAVNIIKMHYRRDEKPVVTITLPVETPAAKPVIENKQQPPVPTIAIVEEQAKEPVAAEIKEPDEKIDSAHETDNKPEKHYLQEILHLLKAQQREKMFSDFSGLLLISGILQIIVVFLMVAAIWFVIRGNPQHSNSAYMCLNFATVTQLIVLTLYVMHQKR